MIQFFRKIRQNLLVENKMGKYMKYAIGEILLVMIGILLALQVSNWNQDRIAVKKEKALLSELHQEFVKNKEQFDKVISKHQEAENACDRWISMFPIDLETINMDSLPGRDSGLHRRWTFDPSQGIINSLVSTSSFELITDRELRNLLVSWNDVKEDFQEDEQNSKKFVMEQLNPFMNEHFHYASNFTDPRLDLSILEDPKFENMIWQRKEYLVDILSRDDEFSTIQKTITRIIQLSDIEK